MKWGSYFFLLLRMAHHSCLFASSSGAALPRLGLAPQELTLSACPGLRPQKAHEGDWKAGGKNSPSHSAQVNFSRENCSCTPRKPVVLPTFASWPQFTLSCHLAQAWLPSSLCWFLCSPITCVTSFPHSIPSIFSTLFLSWVCPLWLIPYSLKKKRKIALPLIGDAASILLSIPVTAWLTLTSPTACGCHLSHADTTIPCPRHPSQPETLAQPHCASFLETLPSSCPCCLPYEFRDWFERLHKKSS